jgi:hypothetical protein
MRANSESSKSVRSLPVSAASSSAEMVAIRAVARAELDTRE